MNHAKPMVRNFSHPDELMPFAAGSAATVRIGDLMVGRLVQEPGWRWSEQVKPIAGTASCQFHHIGVGLAGKAMTRMDDGTELLVQAGDVFDIPPGHDSWVVGDEPAVSIQWGGWRGWGKRPDGDRILTTMLMTDIAGSTERAAQVGDAAWDQLLDRHHRLIREILERYRATEIDTAGDGFFAIFDGAARADTGGRGHQGRQSASLASWSVPASTPERWRWCQVGSGASPSTRPRASWPSPPGARSLSQAQPESWPPVRRWSSRTGAFMTLRASPRRGGCIRSSSPRRRIVGQDAGHVGRSRDRLPRRSGRPRYTHEVGGFQGVNH